MAKVTVEIVDDGKGGVLCAVVGGHTGRGAAYYAALYVQQQLRNTGTTICPACNGEEENPPCFDCGGTGFALLEPGDESAKRLLVDALITDQPTVELHADNFTVTSSYSKRAGQPVYKFDATPNV